MSITVAIEERAVAMVRDVLLDEYVDELELIDQEHADGILTVKPTTANLIAGTRRYDPLALDFLLEVYAAGAIRSKRDVHMNDDQLLESETEVMVRISNAGRDGQGQPKQDGETWGLQQQNMRAATAAVRVLHMKSWELGEPYLADATWNSTKRISPDDDYLMVRRLLSFTVQLHERLS